jgi:hypothetical protein
VAPFSGGKGDRDSVWKPEIPELNRKFVYGSIRFEIPGNYIPAIDSINRSTPSLAEYAF